MVFSIFLWEMSQIFTAGIEIWDLDMRICKICSSDTRTADGDKDSDKHNTQGNASWRCAYEVGNIHFTYTTLKINTTHSPNNTAATLEIHKS
jgi:hypothetical protein